MLNHLSDLLFDWCSDNKLDFFSADDLLAVSYSELTIEQRDWLYNYIELWDKTQQFEVG